MGMRTFREFAAPVMIKKAVLKGTPHSAPIRGLDGNAPVSNTPDSCRR